MSVRKRFLPAGWYPTGRESTTEAIQRMSQSIEARSPAASAKSASALAGVVPHAGWDFSGSIALEVMSCFSRTIDTIVIIGGHLGPADGILCAMEDLYETPLGAVSADGELRTLLAESLDLRPDRSADNSTEVQLPLARYLFPAARALCLRAPPNEQAARLGIAVAAAGRTRRRRIAAVGSTDLTHYGPNYGFSPAGAGESARQWVISTNDRRFIEAMLAMDGKAMLALAGKERSACSAGGALAAVSFAREMGVRQGRLLRYMTSYDVYPAESFVGYAGVLYGS
ncbi:MAG TPA: AmmeMemoRadiSam system protein B [Spirochaetia bacterium]|nr:AmmeMemoRadiSam system protein B [Spirochaetia bacterium]